MAYGYNPRDYVQDFSWIGDTGAAVGSIASQFPKVIEFNRIIKENTKAKEMTYDSMTQWIKTMDDKAVSNIASSMGRQFENIDEAKQFLLSQLPMFENEQEKDGRIVFNQQSNEKYAKDIIDKVSPMIAAARSDRGGGSLKISDILINSPGFLSSGFAGSEFGKRALKQEDAEVAMQRDIAKEGIIGEQRMSREIAKEGIIGEQRMSRELERGKVSADVISQSVQDAKTIQEVAAKVKQLGGTDRDIKEAVSVWEKQKKLEFEALRQKFRQRTADYYNKLIGDRELADELRQAQLVRQGLKREIEQAKETKKDDLIDELEIELESINVDIKTITKLRKKRLKKRKAIPKSEYEKELGETREEVLEETAQKQLQQFEGAPQQGLLGKILPGIQESGQVKNFKEQFGFNPVIENGKIDIKKSDILRKIIKKAQENNDQQTLEKLRQQGILL